MASRGQPRGQRNSEKHGQSAALLMSFFCLSSCSERGAVKESAGAGESGEPSTGEAPGTGPDEDGGPMHCPAQ